MTLDRMALDHYLNQSDDHLMPTADEEALIDRAITLVEHEDWFDDVTAWSVLDNGCVGFDLGTAAWVEVDPETGQVAGFQNTAQFPPLP